MKTFSAKPTDIDRKWFVLDASELPLGRLSTLAAKLLTGKDKPTFTKHIDVGDYVIVINSDKLVVTGNKLETKMYYRHSGYPGNLITATLSEKMASDSTQVIIHSIRGMLPVNKLRDERLNRLKVYKDEKHTHEPQKPSKLDLKKGI
ncbi:MAG TPA: 50S ribosomal protein L13 [Candidatus Saccharimonadia bacterium]|nr:50S ribosomal protein L13 [Candidatus Saccharimonadia bacterium]